MTILSGSPFRFTRLTSYPFFTSIVIMLILVFNQPALSCDVAVISGKVTTDGRPILWKNFDCSEYWKQEVKYYPAKTSKAGDYFLLYHNDDTMKAINGSPVMPQSGANAAGFAASVAAVYEDLAPLHESGNINTDLVQHAVEECATVADWENLLKTWPRSHYNHAISGNFVVVDAYGGAALYECYTGKYTHGLMTIQWKKTDADTGEVIDYTGKVITPAQAGFPGFVNRTNLNSYVWYNSGVDRYLRAKKLLTQLAQKDPVTGKTRLNAQTLMQVISKDVVGSQQYVSGTGGDTRYSLTYCISRSQTRSATVFQGVPAGGDPCQAVYWTAVGEPSLSVFVPNMIGAKSVSPYMYMDTVDGDGNMKDKSDTCLLNIAEDERETYGGLIHSSNRGSVLTGPFDKYINKVELAKLQQWTTAIENTVIGKTSELLNQASSNPELMTPENLQSFTNHCAKYIYNNYKAGSATAEPWEYIAVTGVTLSSTSLNLHVDENTALTAVVAPENATNKAVTWTSSDSTIAAVDQNGKVTGIAPGNATITATTADGAKTATCGVTIYAAGTGPTLDGIAITTLPQKQVYNVGDTLDLTGMVVTGTYSDGSTKIETVTAADVTGFDSSAPSAGQTLTVTVGGRSATYNIVINEPSSTVPDSIAITTLPNKLVYNIGDTLDITGMVVTGTYSNGSAKTETVTTADVTGFDSSAPAASQTLTVTIAGKTATYNIQIIATPGGLIKAAIAKFTPVAGNMTLTETLPYSGSVRVYKIIVSPAAIDANKVESSNLTISTLYTYTAAVPVFPLAELFTGPESTAEGLVSTGVLTEDTDNYIISLTGVDCPQSLTGICNKTDISPLFVMDITNQKLDCQIKISKATGRIVSVNNIKIVGTTKFISGSQLENTIQADSLTLSY